MKKNLAKFTNKIGLKFKNQTLLKRALTHRSYLNEHPDEDTKHNERLEFLGDAVLELVVTDHLFNEYPERTEGELTAIRAALVNTGSLSKVAGKLELGSYLRLSKGEAKDTGRGRQFILADTYEALIGALYLDQNYSAARNFIAKTLFVDLEEIIKSGDWRDAKSVFQEEAQARVGITPTYKTLKEAGPDHDKLFTVGVFLEDEKVAEGNGKSKQEAESEAATLALSSRGWD